MAVAVTGLLLCINSPAAVVVVDGQLNDLIAAAANPDTGAIATESGADAENNGFDITSSYSYFDPVLDVFYLGFETAGPVGDSCTPTGGGICGILNTPNFQTNESYGFQLDVNSDASYEVGLVLVGDGGSGVGPDTATSMTAPGGVVIDWAVSEADDGVEFSVGGLLASGILPQFSPVNPVSVTLRFTGGGAPNPGPEDEAFHTTILTPVPAAAWLLGSALLGLGGIAARRQQRQS
ncbi:MAG: hypothetical protein D6727_10760 [Gammaproteobacteria bacterium]|nr:MAG: hypothetical protein D6727_10760 [Gammaproteobacteria bacterium]